MKVIEMRTGIEEGRVLTHQSYEACEQELSDFQHQRPNRDESKIRVRSNQRQYLVVQRVHMPK
jgi:uncharacterized protein YPO0396